MNPAIGFWRLICSILLGACLGIFYGFLRPPGQRHRSLADLVFSLGALWVWIYICFAVCRGDIRTIYLMGMVLGILLWEATFGRWLRPVFFGLWRFLAAVFRFLLFPWKKFLYFSKILFASVEKWVTIESTKIFKSRKKRRKDTHDPEKHPAQKSESGSSSRIQYP
jgi:hypothetical protein